MYSYSYSSSCLVRRQIILRTLLLPGNLYQRTCLQPLHTSCNTCCPHGSACARLLARRLGQLPSPPDRNPNSLDRSAGGPPTNAFDKGGPSGRSQQTYSRFRPFARAQYIWYNYRLAVVAAGGAGGAFYVYNLEEVPITGRRRFNCVSPEQEKALMSGGAYEQMLQQFRGQILPANHPYTQLVARVVERLLPSVGKLADDEWRVHVIDDPKMVNAFVMPGGKVFVFTGLLPIAQDENGLAAVLGHEIAHNVAHHSAERLSRSLPIMLISILGSLLFDVSGGLTQYVTSLFLELPNGRAQETEADHIGLLMMAQSCYDPDRVPDLWARMADYERKHGGAPPQFLSTHPSSHNRGDTIRRWLPEAHAKYQEGNCSAMGRYVDDFREAFRTGAKQQQQQMSGGGGGWRRSSNDDDDDWF